VERQQGDEAARLIDRPPNPEARSVTRWRRRWPSFLPAAAWMGLIFYLSSQSRLPDAGFNADLVAVAGHVIVFGALAVLVDWGLRREGVTPRRAFIIALGVTVLYGISDEIHQAFVPGRHAHALDVAADAVGAIAALALVRRVAGRSEPKRRSGALLP
jgi:hypothetical protein